MFGYIRISKPELKVKEYELYKAVYCSLCRTLGKKYGIISRFTLSYDFTFLALLNMSLKEGIECIERKRCAFNPLKKCNYCKSSQSLDMPAAAAMILIYYKLRDNIQDEKGFKKIGYLILKPIFASAHKKAAEEYPEIEDIILGFITEQSELEKKNCDDFDCIADPTARALSKLLMLCTDDLIQKRVLERLGYCIGKYIYLLDAANDLEDDTKNESYNVFKLHSAENVIEYTKERVRPQLYFCCNEAAKAFELLDIKKYKSILANIIYFGLEETFKKELDI